MVKIRKVPTAHEAHVEPVLFQLSFCLCLVSYVFDSSPRYTRARPSFRYHPPNTVKIFPLLFTKKHTYLPLKSLPLRLLPNSIVCVCVCV